MSENGGGSNPEDNDQLSGDDVDAGFGVIDFLRARLLLVQLEARDAVGSAKRLFALYAGALFAIGIAYVFGLAGGASLVARKLELPWDVVMLCVAGLHGIAAFAFFLLIKRCKTKQPFAESLNQIEKDRQWLESRTEPPQS